MPIVAQSRKFQCPGQRPVAEKPLHRIDGYRTVLLPAGTKVLAGMGANATDCRRHRVEFRQSQPGLVAGLLQAEPVFLSLGNDAEPTAYVTAVGAPRLARGQLLGLLRKDLERQFDLGALSRFSGGHGCLLRPFPGGSPSRKPADLQ